MRVKPLLTHIIKERRGSGMTCDINRELDRNICRYIEKRLDYTGCFNRNVFFKNLVMHRK